MHLLLPRELSVANNYSALTFYKEYAYVYACSQKYSPLKDPNHSLLIDVVLVRYIVTS